MGHLLQQSKALAMKMNVFELLALFLLSDGKERTARHVQEALNISYESAKCGLGLLCDSGKVVDVTPHYRTKPRWYKIPDISQLDPP